MIKDIEFVEICIRLGGKPVRVGWDIPLIGDRRCGLYIFKLRVSATRARMSARIMLDNIHASSAPSKFQDEMCFEVTFTALQPTPHPICWKITYVGSAYNEDFDQVLEEFEIDPIEASGTMKFDIACKAPEATRIPRKELLSVTALLITASYRDQEFVRVGYYIHNQLVTSEGEQLNVDELSIEQLASRIRRTIISDKPRVTKFNIDWSDSNRNKKKIHSEDSQQSKLSDFFSVSAKSHNEEQDSTSQKLEQREYNEKQSTLELEESQVMISQ